MSADGFPVVNQALDRFLTIFPCTDPDRVFDRSHEDLSISDLPCLGALLDRIDDLLKFVIIGEDGDQNFR